MYYDWWLVACDHRITLITTGFHQELDISTNFIEGTLSSSLSNLTSLIRLHMAENMLSGTIPAELTSLSHLRHVLLGANQFEGTVPSDWGRLSHLVTLSLVANRFHGAMPDVQSNTGLRTLDVSWNKFTGPIAPLGNLKVRTVVSLVLVSMHHTHLSCSCHSPSCWHDACAVCALACVCPMSYFSWMVRSCLVVTCSNSKSFAWSTTGSLARSLSK